VAAVAGEVHGPSDAELITAVREGNVTAYGSLYERHVTSAYNLARQLCRCAAEADDLVSEAFARVLDTLCAGRGPDSAFRAYLLTSLRHIAYDKTRTDRKLELTEDVTTVSGVSAEKFSEPFRDTALAGLERSLAVKAFARLPERWQAVLWHTEIEGQSPADVAPLLGLTANGVSALAYRAREGLRQAYLQVHLAGTAENRCRDTVHKLGAWTRSGLSKRETTQVETHLDECRRCRALAAELNEVNGALRIFVAPLVLGAGASAGYLTLTAGGSRAVAGTAAEAGAAASSGATGAASSAPRQFVRMGASVAALAAALVIALTAGNSPNLPNAAATPVRGSRRRTRPVRTPRRRPARPRPRRAPRRSPRPAQPPRPRPRDSRRGRPPGRTSRSP
jgi:RNA polymerase sigma factor (sigma-70 family)